MRVSAGRRRVRRCFPSRPLRVVSLIKGLGPGGAERLLVSQTRLADRTRVSHRVAYLLPWKQALLAELEAEDVDVVCLEGSNPLDPRWLKRLRELLVLVRADIVHAHSPVMSIGARLVVRTIPAERRPVLVSTEHNVWESHAKLTAFIDRYTAQMDDAHVAVSRAVRDSMPNRLHANTEVVQHGIELPDLDAAAARGASVRAELGLDDSHIVVGTVANLRANKAYPDLLAAARIVVEARPDVRFVAVGQGPLEAEIRSLCTRMKLDGHVTLLGYRSDAVDVIAAMDIFCLASHHEGLPIALMEALSLAKPVVATNVGGVAELIDHGHNGLLVRPARPELFADALLSLIRDRERRDAMAATAQQERERVSAQHAISRIESMYEELCPPCLP